VQAVILCGGKGTRAYPYTEYMPKPMLPVGSQPILLHVMALFAAQGVTDFVLSLGYRKENIIDYFHRKELDWNIEFVDTGEDTDTGGRVLNLRDHLGERFMVTYVDGLSDIPLDKLLAFHESHGAPATVTATPLTSQYGTIEMNGNGQISAFREKPTLREHWINAGFFVFDQAVFDHWEGTNLEQHVLPALVKKKLLYAYQHDGFFKTMDTYKDAQEIERMYQAGDIRWRAPGHRVEPGESGLAAS
jgi:glucose-1-phosphate cytidylyltransferase